jgi:hypothetical protein
MDGMGRVNCSMVRLKAFVYLYGLWLGYFLAGVLLTAFAAPSVVWVGTLLMTVHLCWAGSAAIVLALAWAVSMVWVAAILGSTPLSIYLNASAWALTLFGVWVMAIAFIVMLGFARKPVQQLGFRPTKGFWVLIGLTWSALAVGALCFG